MNHLVERILQTHSRRREHAYRALGIQARRLARWAVQIRNLSGEEDQLINQFGVIDPLAIRQVVENLPYDLVLAVRGDVVEDEGITKRLGPKTSTPTYTRPTLQVGPREAKFTYVDSQTIPAGNFIPPKANRLYGLEERLDTMVLPKRIEDAVPELREAAHNLSLELKNHYLDITPVVNMRAQGLELGVRVTETFSVGKDKALYDSAEHSRELWKKVQDDMKQESYIVGDRSGFSKHRFHETNDILQRRVSHWLDLEGVSRLAATHRLKAAQKAMDAAYQPEPVVAAK